MSEKKNNFKELTEDELDSVIGGINYSGFGKCVLTNGGGAAPALAELVAAIVSQNWVKVSILAASTSIGQNPIVKQCWDEN